MQDPRFNTDYVVDHPGKYYSSTTNGQVFFLPASVLEIWCRPGYQPQLPNKGIDLEINNYYYHQFRYGKSWSKVADTTPKYY